MMNIMGQDGMPVPGTMGGHGQSLDDIVSQNAKMIRRQSMPQGYGPSSHSHPHALNADMRRVSMMDYNSSSPLGEFQYDPNAGMDSGAFTPGNVTPAASATVQQRRSQVNRSDSHDLSLNTTFPNTTPNTYSAMMPPNSAYASPAHPTTANLDMSAMESPYLDHSMSMGMDYGVDQNLNSAMSTDPMHMHLYNQTSFNPQSALSSPMHPAAAQGTPNSGRVSSHDNGGGTSVHTQYGSQGGASTSTARQLAFSKPSCSRCESGSWCVTHECAIAVGVRPAECFAIAGPNSKCSNDIRW